MLILGTGEGPYGEQSCPSHPRLWIGDALSMDWLLVYYKESLTNIVCPVFGEGYAPYNLCEFWETCTWIVIATKILILLSVLNSSCFSSSGL